MARAMVHSSVRPVDEVRFDIMANVEKMETIISAAKAGGRDLTDKELSELNQIDANSKKLSAEFDIAERDAKAEDYLNSDAVIAQLPESMRQAMGRGAGGPGAGPGWQVDSRGCKYAILNATDKATSLLPATERNAFGHYVLARLFGANASTPKGVKMALTGDSNTLGGFLTPELLSGELIDMVRARPALMQAGTRSILMDGDNLTIPRVTSDVVPQTKAENEKFVLSDPTFGASRLQAMTAGCVTTMSRELAEDSRELLAESLGTLLVNAMSVAVDKWGLNGSGSEEPTGLLLRDGIGSTGSIGQVDWLDIAAAATALRNLNHEPTAAIMHPSRYAQLFNTEVGDGINASRGWLNAPPTLANVRFLQSTNCPADKLILGDFSKYVMGLKTSALVEATVTGGEAFVRHQVLVKVSMRFDFVPLMEDAFHVLEGLTD